MNLNNCNVRHRKPEMTTIPATANAKLTPTEFALLMLLHGHPGKVFSRQQLIDLVSGDDCPSSARTVDVHIASLRKKLGGHWIQTARGIGYFVCADKAAA